MGRDHLKVVSDEIIHSFEIANIADAPLRASDGLLIDFRRFRIDTSGEWMSDIGFSARILNKDVQVFASRLLAQRKSAIDMLRQPRSPRSTAREHSVLQVQEACPSTIRRRWFAPSSSRSQRAAPVGNATLSSSQSTTPRFTPDGFSTVMS